MIIQKLPTVSYDPTNPLHPPLKIIRRSQVEAKFGFKRTAIYTHMKRGLIPPNIDIGGEKVGWLEHEVEEVLLARINGADDQVVKALVIDLVARRPKLAQKQIGLIRQ